MSLSNKLNFDAVDQEYHSYQDKIDEWRNVLVIKGFHKATIATLSNQEVEDLIHESDLNLIDDGF